MNKSRRTRWLLGAALLGAGASAPGCIVSEIRDELVTINANMKVTQDILLDASATLHVVQGQLDQVQRTNDLLVQLQAGLGTEEIASTKTQNRTSIISTMEGIDVSLAKMDEHLSALRKTIANIDNTIPFLKFAADDEDEEGGDGTEGELVEGEAPAGDPGAPTEAASANPVSDPEVESR